MSANDEKRKLSVRTDFPILVDTKAWIDAAKAGIGCVENHYLRVITYNIWFDSFYLDERFDALIRIVLTRSADVVCFQEVIPRVAAAVRSSTVLGEMYEISPFPVSPYGSMMLVKKFLKPEFRNIRLPSEMSRSLLLAQFGAGSDGEIPPWLRRSAVATVHLESLNMAHMRKKQLQICAKELAAFPGRSILCGDFNFDDTQAWGDWRAKTPDASFFSHTDDTASMPHPPPRIRNLENSVLDEVLPSFVDQWPHLRPGERGATFDGGLNPQCVHDSREVMRYDRVMLNTDSANRSRLNSRWSWGWWPANRGSSSADRSDGGAEDASWSGVRIHMLGTEPINDEGVRPSDHFGLEVDVQPSGTTTCPAIGAEK
jgi:endonuclease/exonuclease/phosphatase family metal-dependent hydrolase